MSPVLLDFLELHADDLIMCKSNPVTFNFNLSRPNFLFSSPLKSQDNIKILLAK